jgi:dTDP-4-dehydrorhamnose reductase
VATGVLILGASGMLGQALMRACRQRGIDAVGVARRAHPLVDLTIDSLDDAALTQAIEQTRPGVVINAAALVNLTACEADPGAAYRINARLPALLANLSREHGFQLVQISTDHFFAGDGAALHDETAPIQLLNEYARTKFAGEAFALTAPCAWVLRTNLVGFRGEKAQPAQTAQPTFVEWALDGLTRRQPMTLFADYFTSSIAVQLFSDLLLDALPQRPSGLLNLASREAISKQTFIESLAQVAGLDASACSIGSVAALPGARRADSLGLDVRRAETLLGRAMPTLSDTIAVLMAEYNERKSCVTTASST